MPGHGDTRIQITELPVKDTEFFGKHRVFILEFEPELEIYAGSTVAICEFDYRQIKRSFTARSAQIEYAHRHRTTSSGPFDPLDVILGAAEAGDVSIQGGKTLDPDERYRREISEGQSVNIEWSDELQRNRRDLLLLIIGGVLGIAGAAFLEALKLFLPKE